MENNLVQLYHPQAVVEFFSKELSILSTVILGLSGNRFAIRGQVLE